MAVVRVFPGLCTSAFLADMQWNGPGWWCLSGGLCLFAASQAAWGLSDALVRYTEGHQAILGVWSNSLGFGQIR